MSVMRPSDVTLPARLGHLPTDGRGYPLIATIPQPPGDPDFGALSETRKLVLATVDWCAVCALPFRDELRWQVGFDADMPDPGDHVQFGEAPVHEVCGLYATQVCPFVASPYARLGDATRKGQKRPDVVVLTGFKATASVRGEPSPLQPRSTFVFTMTGAHRQHRLTNQAEAAQAYAAALASEKSITLDPAEQTIWDLLARATEEGEDSGPVMAGGAWVVGAAFCPGAPQVQGLTSHASSPMDTLARAALLERPHLMEDLTSAPDPHIAAMATWFRTRTDLPRVLRDWRTKGMQSAVRARAAEQQPARPAPKAKTRAKNKQAKGARRANRKK